MADQSADTSYADLSALKTSVDLLITDETSPGGISKLDVGQALRNMGETSFNQRVSQKVYTDHGYAAHLNPDGDDSTDGSIDLGMTLSPASSVRVVFDIKILSLYYTASAFVAHWLLDGVGDGANVDGIGLQIRANGVLYISNSTTTNLPNYDLENDIGWHRVMAGWDGTTKYMMCDSKGDYSTYVCQYAQAWTDSTQSLLLGKAYTGEISNYTKNFHGLIRNVQIWEDGVLIFAQPMDDSLRDVQGVTIGDEVSFVRAL